MADKMANIDIILQYHEWFCSSRLAIHDLQLCPGQAVGDGVVWETLDILDPSKSSIHEPHDIDTQPLSIFSLSRRNEIDFRL
jgi:hypothetical protein